MQDNVRKDILNVLKRAQKALRREDAAEIKRISDMTIHNASTYQDADSISIAVIMYALYKISSRYFSQERAVMTREFKFYLATTKSQIKKAYNALAKQKYPEYNAYIKKIFTDMKSIEKEFGAFVTEALNQAKIKKGSRIYEHGISAGRTAEMMGISQWELMDYLGQTKIPEQKPIAIKSPKQRIMEVRKLFNIK